MAPTLGGTARESFFDFLLCSLRQHVSRRYFLISSAVRSASALPGRCLIVWEMKKGGRATALLDGIHLPVNFNIHTGSVHVVPMIVTIALMHVEARSARHA